MSYLKVWIHLVFATKFRYPFLQENIRQKVFDHIHKNALKKGIRVKVVGGYTDHIHVLFALTPGQTIAGVAQLIKGESSFWINKLDLTPERFEWQREFFAASVDEKSLPIIVRYIENQETHHSGEKAEGGFIVSDDL